jgi:predicted house-cleaning noncanonical NTP pyrophosphatase (MazG superfamily)
MTIKQIEVTEISVSELTEQISDKLLGKIKSYLKDKQFEETDVFVTRQEAADFFSI